MLRNTAIARWFIVIVVFIVGCDDSRSPQDSGQPVETTIAGCLQTGENAGEFVLVADDKQTYRVEAAEDVELAAHANHRVELTGTLEKSGALDATALKMMASACEA